MTALQFRKQLVAHLRRADQEGRFVKAVLGLRLQLLERVDEYKPVEPLLGAAVSG